MTHEENFPATNAVFVLPEETGQAIPNITNSGEEPPSGGAPATQPQETLAAVEEPVDTDSLPEETTPLAQFRLVGDALLETARNAAKESVQSFEELRSEVLRFHERAAGYEENARLMHSRIENLQQDQVRVLLKPVFERLAGLHAQANDIAEQKRESDASTAGDFTFFAESIEDLFSLYELNSVGAEAGAPFDPRQHAAARVIKTDRTELDGTLQRVIRQGFGFSGSDRVFMPARVAVSRYVAPEEPAPSESGASTPAVQTAII